MSPWIEIDQAMVDRYAELTGDRNWIHVDIARAEREIGGTIAHGMLVLSMFPKLARRLYRVTGVARSLNYGHDRLRYAGPVPVGARIRLRQALRSIEPKGEGLRVVWNTRIEVEGTERPAIATDWIVLFYPLTA